MTNFASKNLTVEANIGFEDRIKRGNYGLRNSHLTEGTFPVTAEQVGDWEWKLFHFGYGTSFEEAIRLMKEEGYDASQIGHLLAFGEKYPEEQRKFGIFGLGSVVEDDVPGLSVSNGGKRWLRLFWDGYGWRRGDRFLGVRRCSESFGA